MRLKAAIAEQLSPGLSGGLRLGPRRKRDATQLLDGLYLERIGYRETAAAPGFGEQHAAERPDDAGLDPGALQRGGLDLHRRQLGTALALDSTHLYAADNHGGQIWRIAKAGGNVQPLAVLQPNTFPFDIAVDNVAVYWSSETDATVAKVPT